MRKELTLFDVYAVSTGAMFSAGFFLLPGIAAAKTGSSVALAYVCAGLLLVPAMLSLSELSTAMPRAGGIYFVLDRALGPLMGTVGGLGTWLSILFKSAFALMGMGAYLALFLDVPIRTVAIAATLAIVLLNLAGARETTRLQRALVIVVLAVMGLFLAQGLEVVFIRSPADPAAVAGRGAFLTHGLAGFTGTVGFVIVSFAGLLKVASISEEIEDPDRNIPLGMALSLATAILVIGLGVFLMTRVIPAAELHTDLAPVATAGERVFHWLPASWGRALIVTAAIFAFSAMANAGLMSSSRYPLAMARDRMLPRPFAQLNRFGSPTAGILLTGGMMIAVLLLLDVESVAKLASALMLLVFGLVNLAVVVMRETGIASYDPGFRSPGYPWLHLIGLLAPFWLIAEMGHGPLLFTLAVVAVALAWYFYYARSRVARGGGAIFHVFERLGRLRSEGLDRELRGILKERGLRVEDPFDEVVARAIVIDAGPDLDFDDVVYLACVRLAERVAVDSDELRELFFLGTRLGDTPVAHGVALPHLRLESLLQPELALVRSRAGLRVTAAGPDQPVDYAPRIHACFFLISPEEDPGRHLRILAEIAGRVDAEDFMERWLAADEGELRQTLLGEQHFLSLLLARGTPGAGLIGRQVRELDLPEGSLIAMIHRAGKIVVPRGNTRLLEDDRLTLIGDPAGIRRIEASYGGSRSEATPGPPSSSAGA